MRRGAFFLVMTRVKVGAPGRMTPRMRRWAGRVLVAVLMLLSLASSARGVVGDLDATFGAGGLVGRNASSRLRRLGAPLIPTS